MGGWYDAFKDLLAIADRLKDAELKQSLAAVRVECAKLAEENARLREELIALREQARAESTMRYRDNVYWRQAEGTPEEGPFCPTCWDGARKPVRMTLLEHGSHWRCNVCDRYVLRPGATPPSRMRVETDWIV